MPKKKDQKRKDKVKMLNSLLSRKQNSENINPNTKYQSEK